MHHVLLRLHVALTNISRTHTHTHSRDIQPQHRAKHDRSHCELSRQRIAKGHMVEQSRARSTASYTAQHRARHDRSRVQSHATQRTPAEERGPNNRARSTNSTVQRTPFLSWLCPNIRKHTRPSHGALACLLDNNQREKIPKKETMIDSSIYNSTPQKNRMGHEAIACTGAARS